jgi:hypothetical protein
MYVHIHVSQRLALFYYIIIIIIILFIITRLLLLLLLLHVPGMNFPQILAFYVVLSPRNFHFFLHSHNTQQTSLLCLVFSLLCVRLFILHQQLMFSSQ